MKLVWQYGRTGGKEYEVADDFPIQVPFTDVPPLEEIELEDQFFIPSEGRWKEIINGLDKEKLDNLTALYPVLRKESEELKVKADSLSQLNAKLMLNDLAIKQENAELKAKSESLAQINSKTMLASLQNSKDIELIKQQLNPTEGGE